MHGNYPCRVRYILVCVYDMGTGKSNIMQNSRIINEKFDENSMILYRKKSRITAIQTTNKKKLQAL